MNILLPISEWRRIDFLVRFLICLRFLLKNQIPINLFYEKDQIKEYCPDERLLGPRVANRHRSAKDSVLYNLCLTMLKITFQTF